MMNKNNSIVYALLGAGCLALAACDGNPPREPEKQVPTPAPVPEKGIPSPVPVPDKGGPTPRTPEKGILTPTPIPAPQPR